MTDKKEEKKVKADKGEAKLSKKLEALQKEKDELFEKLQRVSADYANFQKRVPRQIEDSVSYEKERIIKTLLPALDNFKHTLDKAHSAESVEDVLKGVQIIHEQMLDILKSQGVEQIKAAGEKFDPSLHQALMQRSEPEKPEGVVLEEFQAGYKLKGRVIRPSKVVVNKIAEETEQPESKEEGQ
ncbi:MAG: nucleotide exchange factor GrpE [Planctomycetes bacterium]|nr:nucleotide exchange factor GrpE [Planctomycetota bacterium]